MTASHHTRNEFWEFVKVFLMLQVALGHIGSFIAPQFSISDLTTPGYLIVLLCRTFFRFGELSAYLFVILSGHFIVANCIERIKSRVDFKLINYARRRANRVFFVSALCVCLTFIFDLIGFGISGNTYPYDHPAIINYSISPDSIREFIGNLLFLQPLFVDPMGTNGPLWTIGYIVQFYIVFGVMQLTKRERLVHVSASIIFLIMFQFSEEWALLFFAWYVPGAIRGAQNRLLLTILSIVAIVTLAILEPSRANWLIVAAYGTYLFLFLCISNFYTPKGVGRNLNFVSNLTLPLYLIHVPAFLLTYALAIHTIPNASVYLAFFVGITGIVMASLAALKASERIKI
ncbi:MAG: acyltransferase family protein [Henriciella sp.]